MEYFCARVLIWPINKKRRIVAQGTTLRTSNHKRDDDLQLEIGSDSLLCNTAILLAASLVSSLTRLSALFTTLYELARRLFDSLFSFLFSVSPAYTSHFIPVSYLSTSFDPFALFSKVRDVLVLASLWGLSFVCRLCGLLTFSESCEVSGPDISQF